MTKESSGPAIVLTAVAAWLVGWFSFALGEWIGPESFGVAPNYWKRQAIIHHAAHYDAETGIWQWN